MLSILREYRIIGVTALHPRAGSERVCQVIAKLLARSGLKTLLVDLSQPAGDHADCTRWVPGKDPTGYVVRDTRGYDLLPAGPTPEAVDSFSSARKLRDNLKVDLLPYEVILVALTAVQRRSEQTFNPLVAASACDAVIVVCKKDRTSIDALKATIEMIQASGVKIAGTLLNDACLDGLAGRPTGHVQVEGPADGRRDKGRSMAPGKGVWWLTQRHAAAVVLTWALLAIVLPHAVLSISDSPLGYYLGAQGALVVFAILAFAHVLRQRRVARIAVDRPREGATHGA